MAGRIYIYTVIFEPHEGEHHISVPAFPLIGARAKTLAEARGIADVVVRMGIEELRRQGKPPPQDRESVTDHSRDSIKELITVDLDAAPPIDMKSVTVGAMMAAADQFTDRARKVMKLAKQQATERRHASLDTEHVLLGILDEGSGVAANVLRDMGVDLRRIRAEVEASVRPDANLPNRTLTFTQAAKDARALARDEASRLGQEKIGTEHLLLGLLAQKDGVAARVLGKLGIELEATRRAVIAFISPAPGPHTTLAATPFVGHMGTAGFRARGSIALRFALDQGSVLVAAATTPTQVEQLALGLNERVQARIASFPAASVTWDEEFELHTDAQGNIGDEEARAAIKEHLTLPGLEIDASGSAVTDYAVGAGWFERNRRYALNLGGQPWHEQATIDGITSVSVPIHVELIWRTPRRGGDEVQR